MKQQADFVVIGAGIAGASAAYELAAHGSVLLLEREALPGHHTTGRSAAFWVANYGSQAVRALTAASREFLVNPPPGFSESKLVESNPMLWIARPDQEASLEREAVAAAEAGAVVEKLSAAEAEALCPVLRPGTVSRALCEPGALHIDVATLLEGYLRGLRKRGGRLLAKLAIGAIDFRAACWVLETSEGTIEAPVLVDAAGAWADRVATLSGVGTIGLRPLRRTAITFDPPTGSDARSWPCVVDVDAAFYFKPEGGQLLASPCDETPMEPCDVVPDDYEIALVADLVQRATTLEIRHIRRSWAGLRNFVSDRGPVIGEGAAHPGFFWLAGLGGFGIMTSPAAARALAHLVTQKELPDELRARGVVASDYAPDRPALRVEAG
ncbi:MAG: FAD-binding oxidoreductase [Myxococcota bacterium]